MKNSAIFGIAATALIGLASTTFPAFAQDEKVNIYTDREPGLIEPLLKAFEVKTGIKPVVLFAKDGLIERVASEGENSPADTVITVDVGKLAAAKEAGIFQPIELDSVQSRVPAEYRDSDNAWTALSARARVFYVSRERVDAEAIRYEDLADDAWKGRICTRSGQHVYNIGLFASYLADHGAEDTKAWLEAVRDNLTTRPTGNDRAQVKAIFSGACDLAIGNTYYMGLMQNNTKDTEQQEWAKSVRIVFPSAEAEGTHVNVSGAILAKYAPNKENAEKLIDFLLSDEGQTLYAETNYEYPIVAGVSPSETVSAWGTLVPDVTPLPVIASHRSEASALVDDVLFDDGPQN